MKHSCRCGATWGGKNTAHCGSCHLTFSTVANFDKHHRKGLEGLVLDEQRGVYKSADKRPDLAMAHYYQP